MANEYRSVDGSNNNPDDPGLGQTKQPLLRILPADYGDGISTMAGATRPSAREISNEIFAQTDSNPSEQGLSDFLWIWGQFLDHDISLSHTSKEDGEDAPIAVPLGDAYFDPFSEGDKTIDFTRSQYDLASGTGVDNPRQQLSDITPFIDASNVYGSDAVRQAALRGEDGRMKVSDGDLMPFNVDGLPNAMGTTDRFFLGGDERANENVLLSSVHSLFLREHNRLVEQLEQQNPEWDGDTLYQEARRIVEAEMQAITYNEFLPKLLGENALSDYAGYRADVSPEIANVFSTAAFRLGHTMLSSTIHRVDEDGSENSFGNLALLDAFFRPDRLVTEGGVDALFRGAGTSKSEAIDTQIIDDVRNFLFGPPGSGGFDLAALNIQRGRDHGLDDYNAYREAYGLQKVTTFAEITSDVALQIKLEELFGTVDNIDVFVGGLAEDPVPGSQLGALFHAALVDQFTRLRDGDSFWYETRLSPEEVAEIKATTLSDIIERNTGIETMQDDVFLAMERVAGTDQSDILFSGDEPTLLLGLEGDDIMISSSSPGEMHGGSGNDNLFGLDEADWLVGGENDDQLHGAGGGDYLNAGSGNDFVSAGEGNDKIDAGGGNDYIVTGGGQDRVFFSEGNDVIDDFDVTNDVLDFSKFPNITGIDDLTIKTYPSGTLLTDEAGNTLWLAWVTAPEAIAFDFISGRQFYSEDDSDTDDGGTQYHFGGEGDDTIKVDGYRDDYYIAKTIDGTGYVMWDDTGADIFWHVEYLEFEDEIVELDTIA